MAKLPKYLIVNWDIKPTEYNLKSCDDLYVKSVKIKWWGWPFVFIQLVKRLIFKEIIEYKKDVYYYMRKH